ncbi:cation transporter [Longivirga aurantiaca]|uniref:Cation transporter n=1 Tax=Longivirga aurantiaca TaxID=1837743 RepID=A0ABW1SZJ9_9ACTN
MSIEDGPAGRALTPEAEGLTRRGLRLAQFTVTYNVIEGILAVAAGVAAGLVSLVGFGLDSGIESISAVIVTVRLSARLRNGSTDEAMERRALRGVALTFFVLAAYVVIVGTRDLLTGELPDQSPVGIAILVLSLIVMPWLAWAKTRVGKALDDDRLILADAAETRVCVLLSASTLIGIGLFTVTGQAWLDPVAGYVIAAFAVREGMEAWEGELVEDD